MRTSNLPWDQDKCPNPSPPTRTPSSSHLSRELMLWLSPSLPEVPRGLEAVLPSLQKPTVPLESGKGLLDKGKRDGQSLHPAPGSWDLPGLAGEGFPPSGCRGPEGACSESSLF